jgi:hypothetical protein
VRKRPRAAAVPDGGATAALERPGPGPRPTPRGGDYSTTMLPDMKGCISHV